MAKNKKSIFPEELEEEISYWQKKPGGVMQALRAVQDHMGYVSPEAMHEISNRFNIPLTEIYGIVTFYHYFKTTKPGKHRIRVCMGTACYIKGGGSILSALENLLRIKEGETTKDGEFSLEAVRCLGCCGLAPVMMIDDKVYGKLTPTEAEKIVKSWMRGVKV